MRFKNPLIFILLFSVAFFTVSGLSGCKSDTSKGKSPSTVMLDQEKMKYPNAKDVRGKTVKISDYEGKPLVLNFWAPWCPPCRAEAPALQRAYNYYKNKDVQFLMVSIRDSDENVVKFMKEERLSFPVGLDTDAVLASNYDVTAIPTTFFIKSNGELSRKYVGAMSEQQMANFIEELI